KLGQNFLRDERVARRIVDLVPEGNAPLLEIGPGQGALSRLLLERFPGRRLVLVEVDRFFAAELRQRFADRAQVLNDDVLRIDAAALFGGQPAIMVGNLPYHISKPLLDWFIAQHGKIAAAVLMLQRDFIDKLLAPSGGKKYNAQSVLFQLLFQARRCFDVPANAFVPRPKVVSTVIAAQPLPTALPDVASFYAFVRTCFTERRKTLWNNLSPRHSPAELTAAFAVAAIPAQARAEQLAPERFAALWQQAHADVAGSGE
ncbi:MAG: 16S rRNA (adenine(1518)-N(6)/adenine(1519)-N(6))-dimethyltransferase RsmA, partial [Acidobacteria bacterium]|nr:16S rRNA (adenine(1518)-N(6)/adenine(1519)-N(6))-dimethyltransferase RsmA [Acidobacteriota bacterium]